MREGFYTDPQYQRVKPKIAVVITFFSVVKDYKHFVDDKLESIKLNLKAHMHFAAGVDYDLIIVNHSEKMIDISLLNEWYTKGGHQIHKDNFGYSFGGWKQAWDEFKDTYDYYLFTEDDIAPSKDGWLAEIVLKFLSEKNIGAVGNVVEGRSRSEQGSEQIWKASGSKRDMAYNLDGAFTFTSSKVLKQVDEIGGLIVVDTEPNTSVPGTVNETIFQERIMELGYKIVSFADGQHFVVHGSEIFTNDVLHRSGPFCPLMNLNARHKIPEITELYKFLNKK